MRIVHLSDLHLSKDNLGSLKQFYLTALIKDLKIWHSESPIDLIVLTGDLVDKGGSSFTDGEDFYQIVENDFINPILSELKFDRDRFIIIPGNHDIVESKIEDISEDGILKFNDVARINKYLNDNKETFHSGIERTRAYTEFEKQFYKSSTDCYLSNFESCFVVTINGEKIGIGAFNSSWRCSTNLPKDKLLFGTQQILNANDFFKREGTKFNIALIHHPVEFISDIERQELTSFLYTMNFNVLLSGHTHKSDIIHSLGTRNKLFTSVAKSAFSNPREKIETFKAGYSILDFARTKTDDIDITCNFRKYIHDRLSFDKDVDVSENGEYKDQIKTSSNDDAFNKYLILTDKTCKAKQELMNNSLVIHGTDSIAPRDLNDIFVLPKLTEKPILMNDIDEEINILKLSDILNSDKNILLIGDKETGKSTLLNKIFVEASNSYANYQIIPVEIDFSELKKKDIKALATSFLNEPEHAEVEEILKQGKLLVLIDNYIENEEYTHAVNRKHNVD